ncbi:MAG: methyltransferase domain-containing protein [Oscillospiraceae bacterium]|nr:methyltransferase domain-containing protein [Oscillospiraceae bacterium]
MERIVDAENLAKIKREIASLPEIYGKVMVMYYLDELSIAEIAKRLNIPENRVKQRLFAAREKIRKEVFKVSENQQNQQKQINKAKQAMQDPKLYDLWFNFMYGYGYDEDYGNQQEDVNLLLSLIGNGQKNILEACCGTGRVLVPLAEAGHNMTGFDCQVGMLACLYEKAKRLVNAKYYYADAIKSDWGSNFDVVIIACNTIQNIDEPVIISDSEEYKEAQKTFISKSAKALKQGGHLFFTFDLHANPQEYWNCAPSEEYFIDTANIDMSHENPDIFGVRSRSVSGGYQYDAKTQIAHGIYRRITLFPKGERNVSDDPWYQRLLTLGEVHEWLADSGFEIEQEYNGYHKEPIKENQFNNVVIWARKI